MEYDMKKEYNFSKAKKNPYLKHLKIPVSIRLDDTTVYYFKELATKMGMRYQTLINLYLRDCADHHKKLKLTWK